MSGITFNDVLFEPQYSEVLSREDVDVSSVIGPCLLQLPVISANMPDITESYMCGAMTSEGGIGICHRFMSIEDAVEEFKLSLDMVKNKTIMPELPNYQTGVSIGVGEGDYRERFQELYKAGARMFCIDVAHGHHLHVKNTLEWIRSNHVDESFCLIAGNVATSQGARDLFSWGADVVKVGIGPGSKCETRKNTGVGVPQLQALKEIRESSLPGCKIIADGGARWTGDVAKALYYADAIMVGRMVAGTIEGPGEVYEDEDGNFYKMFGGSASGENKVRHGKANKFVEGHRTRVPFRGHVKFILRRIRENLQSALSYSGAFNLNEFREKAVLKSISGSSKEESKI